MYKGDEDRGRTGQNGRATEPQLKDGSYRRNRTESIRAAITMHGLLGKNNNVAIKQVRPQSAPFPTCGRRRGHKNGVHSPPALHRTRCARPCQTRASVPILPRGKGGKGGGIGPSLVCIQTGISSRETPPEEAHGIVSQGSEECAINACTFARTASPATIASLPSSMKKSPASPAGQ